MRAIQQERKKKGPEGPCTIFSIIVLDPEPVEDYVKTIGEKGPAGLSVKTEVKIYAIHAVFYDARCALY
eukprot:8367394-Karenia_brevis.AAC.1